jgi:FkbM family methyltransferase
MTRSVVALDQILGADWLQTVETRRLGIAKRISGRTDLLLFGSGALGRQVHADLRGQPFRVLAFVDNNPRVWGTKVDGLDVIGPVEAKTRYRDDALWLITIYTNRQVIKQCRQLGVPWMTCAELSWVMLEPRPSNFVFGVPELLAEFAPVIESASGLWADDDSQAEYAAQVRWRFLLDYEALAPPMPTVETYFPEGLIRPLADEVFVDCGAYTGDTIEAFLAARGGQFGKIVAIEPDLANCQALTDRIKASYPAEADRIRVEPLAVGSRRGTLTFDSTGTVRSRVGAGTTTVDVAPMDELLADSPPTYIKFDVEGAEHDAIVGGEVVIRTNMPVLAVSAYHKPEDLWDLPLLVRSIRPDYRMFLRRYSDERWEQVLYAVPPDRVIG